jgi:hypothetical protein
VVARALVVTPDLAVARDLVVTPDLVVDWDLVARELRVAGAAGHETLHAELLILGGE